MLKLTFLMTIFFRLLWTFYNQSLNLILRYFHDYYIKPRTTYNFNIIRCSNYLLACVNIKYGKKILISKWRSVVEFRDLI